MVAAEETITVKSRSYHVTAKKSKIRVIPAEARGPGDRIPVAPELCVAARTRVAEECRQIHRTGIRDLGILHLPDRRTKTRPMILLIRQLQILTVRSQEEIQIPPIQKKMLLQNPRTAMMIPISLLLHQ